MGEHRHLSFRFELIREGQACEPPAGLFLPGGSGDTEPPTAETIKYQAQYDCLCKRWATHLAYLYKDSEQKQASPAIYGLSETVLSAPLDNHPVV